MSAESPEATFELLEGVPRPALRGVVRGYTGFSQRTAGPVRFRELPCTYVPVILDMGAGWRVDGAPLRSFTAGLVDAPVLVEHGGWAQCLQVDLTPVGARRLLGLPMSELAGRSVPLEDVLGPWARDLPERLEDARSWETRFALVDRALARRLEDAEPENPAVTWAFRRLAAAPATESIGGLARELGWSHRRLIARFRDQVGLPPKRVARILRFERLVASLGADPRIDWVRAALTCGYFDQAHMAREVRRLSGLTPTALRAERVNFVQDAPGLVA